MSGKRYLKEFKIESVRQTINHGHSVSNRAARLDIIIRSPYAWIKSTAQPPH